MILSKKNLKLVFVFFITSLIITGCEKVEEHLTEAASNIKIKPFRYHYPIRLAIIKSEDSNGTKRYLTEADNQHFEITFFEVGGNADCIVNAIGTNEVKIFSTNNVDTSAAQNSVIFGIHEDCIAPNEDNFYRIGVKVEDLRTPKQYMTSYKYILLGDETDLFEMHLKEASLFGTSRLEEKSVVHQTIEPSLSHSFLNGEVSINFPTAFFQDQQGEAIGFGQNQKFNVGLTYIKQTPDEDIQNNPAFPIPALAQAFLDTLGNDAPKIGEFYNTDFVGIEIKHQQTNTKAFGLANNNLMNLRVKTNNGSTQQLQIWRIYQENSVYKWQRLMTNITADSTGTVTFNSPLSIGWAICSSPPLSSCDGTDDALYASASFSIDANINNSTVGDFFVAKLFDANTGNEETSANILIHGNLISIYNVSDKPTILRLYRKQIDGSPASEISSVHNFDGCGAITHAILDPGSVTSLYVDIRDAFCDIVGVNVDRSAEIWTIPLSVNSNKPSLNSPNWMLLGYMYSGEFTTVQLVKDKEYWFKVSAPEYNEEAVLHRALKIETNGIVPQVPTSNNNGRLICTEVGGDYNCQFVIDDSFSIEDLFGNGYNYCSMLL